MSKVAILSDVHGNLRALRAVLREVDSLGVEVLAVAGDIIGYGAHPGECIELVQDLGALAVLGNYESYADRAEQRGLAHAEPEEAAGPVAALVRTVRNLSPEQMQWIRQLRLTEVLAPNAVMAHATLHEPEKWHYLHHARDAQPTLDLMRDKGIELGFFGHTHSQRWFAHPGVNSAANAGNCSCQGVNLCRDGRGGGSPQWR